VPLLWLYGPAGVGKTTVGWEIFGRLRRADNECAYVDIDQLGICYPEPPSDPGRYRLEARNLNAVVANFAAAGARSVIVSGVADPAHGISAHLVPAARLLSCRLRADPECLRQRILGRGGDSAAADDAQREADLYDAQQAALVVDTTDRSPDDVATEAVSRAGGLAALIGRRPADPPMAHCISAPAVSPAGARPPVLLLCGPTGVGKSTVGFEIYLRGLRAGQTAAYIDLDQLGFWHSAQAEADRDALKAGNLAAVWANFQAAGAQQLVLTGPVGSERAAATYSAALPSADVTICRLHAGLPDLARRIETRGRGGSWPQPGDPLAGQSSEFLRRVAEQAASDGAELDTAAIGVRVDTDGRSVAEVADLVLSCTGWPNASAGEIRQ
jgi:adenylylsulfate kinase-like enzyme